MSAIGLYAYALPLGFAGVAGVAAAIFERRLPSPGRVRVPRTAPDRTATDPRLGSLARVLVLASLAGGLSPFLTVYAISVLHTGPGFAIGISAVSSGSLVVASLVISTSLRHGSASRLLRGSLVLRGFALWLGLTAFPSNPFAPLVLLLVAVLLAAGDTAGQLSANERLFRLATGPSVIAFQSRLVVPNVGAYTAGMSVAASVMLLGGFPSFAILFVGAGAARFTAARFTELSPVERPLTEPIAGQVPIEAPAVAGGGDGPAS